MSVEMQESIRFSSITSDIPELNEVIPSQVEKRYFKLIDKVDQILKDLQILENLNIAVGQSAASILDHDVNKEKSQLALQTIKQALEGKEELTTEQWKELQSIVSKGIEFSQVKDANREGSNNRALSENEAYAKQQELAIHVEELGKIVEEIKGMDFGGENRINNMEIRHQHYEAIDEYFKTHKGSPELFKESFTALFEMNKKIYANYEKMAEKVLQEYSRHSLSTATYLQDDILFKGPAIGVDLMWGAFSDDLHREARTGVVEELYEPYVRVTIEAAKALTGYLETGTLDKEHLRTLNSPMYFTYEALARLDALKVPLELEEESDLGR